MRIHAGFEKLIKDREGEIKLTFTIPLSDQAKALEIPHQTELILDINYEDTQDTRQEQDSGHQDL